jgi:hypothetical protein
VLPEHGQEQVDGELTEYGQEHVDGVQRLSHRYSHLPTTGVTKRYRLS